MELSIFLAKIIGLYLILKALIVLANYRRLPNLVAEFLKSEGLRLTAGLIVIILGLLIVVSHNIWTANWRIIITLYGWTLLLKGLAVLLLRFPVEKFLALSTNKICVMIISLVVLLLGVYLAYLGFLAY